MKVSWTMWQLFPLERSPAIASQVRAFVLGTRRPVDGFYASRPGETQGEGSVVACVGVGAGHGAAGWRRTGRRAKPEWPSLLQGRTCLIQLLLIASRLHIRPSRGAPTQRNPSRSHQISARSPQGSFHAWFYRIATPARGWTSP